MEKIKFKAYSKITKEIYDLICIDFSLQQVIVNDESESEYSTWMKLSEFILMQFTGLKDKNGKEIYEGDIVSFESVDCGGVTFKQIFKVIFYEARFGLQTIKSHVFKNNAIIGMYNDKIEVVGDIHTTPELLNSKT